MLVVDSNGGYIITDKSRLARKIQQLVQTETVKEFGTVRLYLEHGTFQNPATQEHTKRSSIVLNARETTVGGASVLSVGVSPMASVGEVHSCLLRNRQKLSCKSCPLKARLWMQALMMKRLKFSDPMLSWSDMDRPFFEVQHHVASGHAKHRTWCDACMRARGPAGRYERRVPGVAIDYGYLKLDGTEDDEDDDDETIQNKPLILVAKDAKT